MRFVTEAGAKGQTTVYLVQDSTVVAAFALADVIRPESREAVQRLHALGIQVAMLTGDAQAVAQAVAQELGIDLFFAEVLPDHKDEQVG
jgi:Cu2+-exporting ATPase